MKYDLFISHASEDKNFVRPLAEALSKAGLNIWFDEFVLKLGDSLRKSIDTGIRNSLYGLVILSPHFFKKKWPESELGALVSLESAKNKKIIPIWHNVDDRDVVKYSPLLADKYAILSSIGISAIIEKIMHLFTSEPSGKKTEGKYKTSFKYDIFIGHCMLDMPVVEKIYGTLQAEGLTCFIASKHVKFGELVTESVKSAIINSMEICMLLTPNHVNSKWVIFECGAAWILNKPITLLLYQISHSKLQSPLWRYQTFEIQDLDKYAKEVLKRKTLLHSG